MNQVSSIQILVVANAVNADKQYIDQLVQYMQKAKPEYAIGLFLAEPTQDKRLLDIAAKGKLFLWQLDKQTAFNKQVATQLQAIDYTYAVVSYTALHTVSSLFNWATQAKKLADANALVVATQPTVKGGKNNPSFAHKLYNSFTRLFSPVKLSDAQSQVLMGAKKNINESFNHSLATAANYAQTLYNASASGIQLTEAVFGSDKRPPAKPIQAILNILTLRFGYYLKQSLHDIKNNTLSFSNGNHPLYRLLFFVLAVGAMVVYPIISQDYGSTWDEKAHNDYAQLSYQYFSSFGSDTAALAEPKSNADYVRQAYRFYGEQMNTIAAFIYNWFGTGIYETRHFVNSLYALIGLIFTALLALQLTNFRGGLIALLFMAFNPGWLGHGSNNPTDIPFAAAFGFAGYYLFRVMQQLPKPKFSLVFWLSFGIGLGIASRVAAFLLLAYVALVLGVYFLHRIQQKDKQATQLIPAFLKLFFTIFGISYFFGIITWPYGLSNPFKHPWLAFSKASENAFYTNNVELFEGVRMYMLHDAPWYYVLKFMGIGNPIYLLVGLVLSVILLPFLGKKYGWSNMAMLLFMVVFPIAYAEYSNVNYYNGWRHYLFILPAMVPLAAMAYEYLLGQTKIIGIATAIILLPLFGKPTLWMIQNHPHQYVYFNEIAGGLKGAYGTYETDYYSNSCRMAGEWIAKQHPVGKVTVGINNEITTAAYWAQKINPDINFIWVREYEEQKPEWDYLILTSRTFSKKELLNGSFPPANTVYTVEVDGVPLAAVVKRNDFYMPLGYKALDAQKFDSAVYYFNAATQLHPNDEESWRMLGFSYLSMGVLDSAEYFNKKAISIYPQNFSAYSNMGISYFNRKQFNEAIAYFDTATKYKENLTECWYYSGLAFLNQNNYEQGIKRLENCIKHNGQFAEAYYYLAKAQAAVGSLNKSAENYQIALSLNQRLMPAWQELANVFNQLGKTQEAQYCISKYRELGGQ